MDSSVQLLILIFVTSPRKGGGHIIRRRLLERLVFYISNLANLNCTRRQGNGRCPCELYSYASCVFRAHERIRHTIQRGLSSLLILVHGQCEGLGCGISGRYSSHALFILCLYLIINTSVNFYR